MKKLIIICFVLVLCAPFVLFAGGGKEEEPAEKVTETKAEPVKASDADDPDPWIIDVRKGLEPYRGTFNFKGPDGQTPTWDTDLVLTKGEVQKIQAGLRLCHKYARAAGRIYRCSLRRSAGCP